MPLILESIILWLDVARCGRLPWGLGLSLHALSSPCGGPAVSISISLGGCQQLTPLLKAPHGSCPILGSEMFFLTLRLRDLRLLLSTAFPSILSHRAKNNSHGAHVWTAHSSLCPWPCPVPVGRMGEGAGSLAGAAALSRLWCECWGGSKVGAGGCAGGCIWDSSSCSPPGLWAAAQIRGVIPASSAGNKRLAAARGCQGAGCGAGVGGRR